MAEARSRISDNDSQEELASITSDDTGSSFDSRPIKLTIYTVKSQFDARAHIRVERILVHPNWTYGNVETIINRRFKGHLNGVTDETLAQTIVLEPRFGTAPYWIESYRTRSIGSISQTLYAIVLIPRVHYTLGVVRTEASDYPIPIFKLADVTFTTIYRAVVASHPDLAGEIKSITLLSTGQEVMQNAFERDEAETITPSTFPRAFIIRTADLSATFKSEPSPGPVPPLLQVLLLRCKSFAQQAYELPLFSLQMIHLSSALLHLVISSVESVRVALDCPNADAESFSHAEELLEVAPALVDSLESNLNYLESIPPHFGSAFVRQTIQFSIFLGFTMLCSDYPGATTVRRSYETFQKLATMDDEEDLRPVQMVRAMEPITTHSSNIGPNATSLGTMQRNLSSPSLIEAGDREMELAAFLQRRLASESKPTLGSIGKIQRFGPLRSVAQRLKQSLPFGKSGSGPSKLRESEIQLGYRERLDIIMERGSSIDPYMHRPIMSPPRAERWTSEFSHSDTSPSPFSPPVDSPKTYPERLTSASSPTVGQSTTPTDPPPDYDHIFGNTPGSHSSNQ